MTSRYGYSLTGIREIRTKIDRLTAHLSYMRDIAEADTTLKADFRFAGNRLEKALAHVDAVVARLEGK